MRFSSHVYVFTLLILSESLFANNKIESTLKKVYETFSQGQYEETISEIAKIESKNTNVNIKNFEGLVQYWKALTYSRMNEYPLAIEHFENSLKLRYFPQDIYYEYGQALYVSEKLLEARIAFKKSVQKLYKRGASLYYMAFISQTLKDFNKASSFYHAIEKLPEEEKKDVVQAARMQVGDIYWEKVKQSPNIYASLTKYVIPQYENALAWDENSSLAPVIKKKIDDLKRQYDIELFQMRNGRNTARPPYFLRVNALFGNNDNINLLDKDSIDSSTVDVGANFQTIGFFGRYTYYPNSTFSLAPELRINSTKYLSDESTLFANDNYSISTNLKINYEKIYNKAPATTYIDIGYTTSSDDADADKKIENNFTQTSFSISEERQFIHNNPTILRLRYSQNTDVNDTESLNTTSFIWEQLVMYGNFSFYLFSSFDQIRYPNSDTSNTNGYTIRGDFIFPTFFNIFNPILYASTNSVEYINNESRGTTKLSTLGLSINRPIGKNWYFTMDYADSTQSAKLDSDVFKQKVMSFNIDYIY